MPLRQRRIVCRDCGMERIPWRSSAREAGPPDNCFRCGSPYQDEITFEGLFDSTTPPDVMTSLLIDAAAEDERIAQSVRTDVGMVQPAPVLLLDRTEWPPSWVGW